MPGTMIAGRYRIVGMIGYGAMGEVYRADDLTLDQPVGLKFLHPALAAQPSVAQRFRREVRLARQVTHQNVARVYDFVEAGDEAFISMEFIDGEDLASLLRRIGKLPAEKVVDVARQLCAGLAAAHAQGVLHRDLKPGNIMIDGRGQVRITDFGIAALSVDAPERGISPGTPAYMAPELFRGEDASPASDLYSLGLVLYEMVTGVQAMPSGAAQRMAGPTAVTPPDELGTQLDPRLNRAIMECLHPHPGDRPESALTVAGMLPGGDPLALALAAGQTPSPDLVAESHEREGLTPAGTVTAFLLGLGLLLAVVILADRTFLVPQAGLTKSPQILAYEANSILELLGYSTASDDEVYGFAINQPYLRAVEQPDKLVKNTASVNLAEQAAAVVFWFRRAGEPIIPDNPLGDVGPDSPAKLEPGDVRMRLDGRGRLMSFMAWPAAALTQDNDSPTAPAAQTALWSVPFSRAGLDYAAFRRTPATVAPPLYADELWSWSGPDPHDAGRSLTVEGATRNGKVVYFEVRPWWWSDSMPEQVHSEEVASRVLGLFLFITTLLGAAVLAQRNMALGRVDYRGAFRVAAYGSGVLLLAWAFLHRHVPAVDAAAQAVFLNLAMATFYGLMIWIFYIALEPLVRRFWPETIISWSRLVKGRLFDPLIGRDVLVGCVCGIAAVLLRQSDILLGGLLSEKAVLPRLPFMGDTRFFSLLGPGKTLGEIFAYQFVAIRAGLLALMLMLLLRVALRSKYLAGLAFCVIVATTFSVMAAGQMYMPWLVNILMALALATLVIRGGALQVIVTCFVFFLLMNSPLTAQLSRWYGGPALVALGTVVAMLLFGFFTALAGRPVFRTPYAAGTL